MKALFFLLPLSLLVACQPTTKSALFSTESLVVPEETSGTSGDFGSSIENGAVVADKIFTFTKGSESSGSNVELSSSDFSIISSSGCNKELKKASDKCLVKVKFVKNKVAGSYSASLKVGSEGLMKTIPLSATVLPIPSLEQAPNLNGFDVVLDGQVLSSGSVSFGSIDFGSTLTKIIELKKYGPTAQVPNITLGNSLFSIVTNNCSKSLTNGKTCLIKIKLTHTQSSVAPTGEDISSTILDGSHALVVGLGGHLNPIPSTPALSADIKFYESSALKTSLDFGSVSLASISKIVTIKNEGSAAASLASLILSGDSNFVISSHNCLASLGVNKSCSVRLRVDLGGSGSKSGSLSYAGNSLSLSANLVAPSNKPPAPVVTISLAPDGQHYIVTATCHTDKFGLYLDVFYQYTGSETNFDYPYNFFDGWLHEDLSAREGSGCQPVGLQGQGGTQGLVSLTIPIDETMRGQNLYAHAIEKGADPWDDNFNSDFSEMVEVFVPELSSDFRTSSLLSSSDKQLNEHSPDAGASFELIDQSGSGFYVGSLGHANMRGRLNCSSSDDSFYVVYLANQGLGSYESEMPLFNGYCGDEYELQYPSIGYFGREIYGEEIFVDIQRYAQPGDIIQRKIQSTSVLMWNLPPLLNISSYNYSFQGNTVYLENPEIAPSYQMYAPNWYGWRDWVSCSATHSGGQYMFCTFGYGGQIEMRDEQNTIGCGGLDPVDISLTLYNQDSAISRTSIIHATRPACECYGGMVPDSQGYCQCPPGSVDIGGSCSMIMCGNFQDESNCISNGCGWNYFDPEDQSQGGVCFD